jgi:hypothetical protein
LVSGSFSLALKWSMYETHSSSHYVAEVKNYKPIHLLPKKLSAEAYLSFLLPKICYNFDSPSDLVS